MNDQERAEKVRKHSIERLAREILLEDERFISPLIPSLVTALIVATVFIVLFACHVLPILPLTLLVAVMATCLSSVWVDRIANFAQSSLITEAYNKANTLYVAQSKVIEMHSIVPLNDPAQLKKNGVIDNNDFDDEEDDEAALLSKGSASGRLV